MEKRIRLVKFEEEFVRCLLWCSGFAVLMFNACTQGEKAHLEEYGLSHGHDIVSAALPPPVPLDSLALATAAGQCVSSKREKQQKWAW